MLYKREQLPKHSFDDGRVAITRYMHKFTYQRNEIKRLKWHEKHFLFTCMYVMTYDGGKRFDLLTIPEAKEWVFDHLLLIYLGTNRKIDFSVPAQDYYGKIPDRLKRKHMVFFWKCMEEWKQELESGRGVYGGILRNEYHKKIAYYEQMSIPKPQKIQRQVYVRATFFHIYYIIRMYFDEKPEKYEMEVIDGFNVVADIYTYCHVLSRHYFWMMREGGATLNDDIELLETSELPKSLLNMVQKYSSCIPLTRQVEYLLFEYRHTKYILWLKFGHIESANIEGFQIRSFYKCETEKDILKFEGTTMHKIDESLVCFA